MKVEVVCIDDRNIPSDIPSSKHVKKGEKYTIVNVIKCNSQGGVMCAILEEIDMSSCAPYLGYSLDRFAPPTPDLVKEEAEELEIV